MNDKLDIRSIFRVDADQHRDALALIWDQVAGGDDFLDLDAAVTIVEEMQSRQLRHALEPVVQGDRSFIAHIYSEPGQNDPSQSVTFFSPVYRGDGDVIVEAAPVALNKGQGLDFAMLVNFGCCSRAALSLVAMFHANNEFFVVQKDAENVKPEKRGFFENLYQDFMHTPQGSHVAMHAIGHTHNCADHHDGFNFGHPHP